MREILVRGKNTIDPEVIDPGGRSVEDSPVKSDFTFYLKGGGSLAPHILLRWTAVFNINPRHPTTLPRETALRPIE
jgi:hypothetical protein